MGVQGDPPGWRYNGNPWAEVWEEGTERSLKLEVLGFFRLRCGLGLWGIPWGIQAQTAVGCSLPSPQCEGGLWGAQGEQPGDGDGWGSCWDAGSCLAQQLPASFSTFSPSPQTPRAAPLPTRVVLAHPALPCHSLALLECHHHHCEVLWATGLGTKSPE